MIDKLGDRMKEYEGNFNQILNDNLPIVVRLDGRSFSTFTKDFSKPYCPNFLKHMEILTKDVMEEFGFKYSYCQSDEISLILWKSRAEEQFIFGGKINKLNSIIASFCSIEFNKYYWSGKIGLFDCRSFNLPDKKEVVNYLMWRSKDCYRNAITRIAQTYYSHKQLDKKNNF